MHWKPVLWNILIILPALFLVYTVVISFTVTVILPACFVLLLVRTAVIERKVETGFAVRQEVNDH